MLAEQHGNMRWLIGSRRCSPRRSSLAQIRLMEVRARTLRDGCPLNTFSTEQMSYRTPGHASHLRQQSLSASASTQSSALQQRINEKRVELENLKQLRDLSAGLAGQMEQLEEKLGTLSNGTEGTRICYDFLVRDLLALSCRCGSLKLAQCPPIHQYGLSEDTKTERR